MFHRIIDLSDFVKQGFLKLNYLHGQQYDSSVTLALIYL